jgi:hypothetical protein
VPTLDARSSLERALGEYLTDLLKETIMTNMQAALNTEDFVRLSDCDLDEVNGGWFPFIALGVAIGIGYCIWDGTLGRVISRPARRIWVDCLTWLLRSDAVPNRVRRCSF